MIPTTAKGKLDFFSKEYSSTGTIPNSAIPSQGIAPIQVKSTSVKQA